MATAWLALAALALTAGARGAEDEPESSKADALAKQRLEIMRTAIDNFRTSSPQIESEAALRFVPRALLRYSDQSREAGGGVQGVLDATLWRLGESGRPTAFVTLEIYLVRDGNALLTYEFVSLSPQQFEMKNARGPRWSPASTELAMAPLADAPAPAGSRTARLAQMRQLSRRFTAQEKLRDQKIECRLLAQPVDRYEDPAAGILEGAAFVFANGTNPEMGLILECSDKQWSYGFFRLATATLFAQFDGKLVLESKKAPGWPVNANYTATRHPIVLPE